MPAKVLVLGLDAAEATLIERWAAAGELATFADLTRRGAVFRLDNPLETLPEAIWHELQNRARRRQDWALLRTLPDPQRRSQGPPHHHGGHRPARILLGPGEPSRPAGRGARSGAHGAGA